MKRNIVLQYMQPQIWMKHFQWYILGDIYIDQVNSQYI